MIHCPACNAENPIGTKLCVKCGTELPKVAPAGSAEAKKAAPASTPTTAGERVRHASHDLVDLLWLALILFVVLFGFLGQTSHWTFSWVEKLPARLMGQPMEPAPVVVANQVKGVRRASSVAKKPAARPLIEQPATRLVNTDKLYSLSKTKYDQYDYTGSFKLLKQALDIDPTFSRAYFGLGYLYARFDMDDSAVRMYQTALKYNPSHAESINNLAMMYLGAGNTVDAKELLVKAVQLDPKNPDFRYNLGTMYLDEQRWVEAESELSQAAGARPKDAGILNDLALSYEAQGKRDDAVNTWKKVLEYADDPAIVKQAHAHLEYLQQQS
jgi:Flp pilus assembly protein TadD